MFLRFTLVIGYRVVYNLNVLVGIDNIKSGVNY